VLFSHYYLSFLAVLKFAVVHGILLYQMHHSSKCFFLCHLFRIPGPYTHIVPKLIICKKKISESNMMFLGQTSANLLIQVTAVRVITVLVKYHHASTRHRGVLEVCLHGCAK
jgi:hypothetical protein